MISKKDFIAAAMDFDNPTLRESDIYHWPYLSCVIILSEGERRFGGKRVELAVMRLSGREYQNKDHSAYHLRVNKAKHKCIRWCNELFGEYYTDKLSIKGESR